MQLTARDIEIIRWIDSFGYVTAQQVFSQFNLNPKRGYRRLRLLAQEGYLLHKRIFVGQPGIYQAGGKGLALIADDPEQPPGLASVKPAIIAHNLLVVDLALALARQMGGAWRTDRQIRRDKGFVPQGYHVPDGVLTLPGGKKVAVELELTTKSTRRLEKIMKSYARATEYNEVWYFAQRPALAEKIRERARRMPFIIVFMLSEVIRDGAGKERTG